MSYYSVNLLLNTGLGRFLCMHLAELINLRGEKEREKWRKKREGRKEKKKKEKKKKKKKKKEKKKSKEGEEEEEEEEEEGEVARWKGKQPIFLFYILLLFALFASLLASSYWCFSSCLLPPIAHHLDVNPYLNHSYIIHCTGAFWFLRTLQSQTHYEKQHGNTSETPRKQ